MFHGKVQFGEEEVWGLYSGGFVAGGGEVLGIIFGGALENKMARVKAVVIKGLIAMIVGRREGYVRVDWLKFSANVSGR